MRVFDGVNGWLAGPDIPVPIITLATGNLDRARIEATLAFPAGIKQLYPQWRVGKTTIGDRDVTIVQGTKPGLLPVNLYFDDESGLLVRVVRWNETSVGPVPTEINYGDYRVTGVRCRPTATHLYAYDDQLRRSAPTCLSRFAFARPPVPLPYAERTAVTVI